jgi:hypothetical protein
VSKKSHIGLGRGLTMFGSNSGPLEHPTYKSVSFCVINQESFRSLDPPETNNKNQNIIVWFKKIASSLIWM